MLAGSGGCLGSRVTVETGDRELPVQCQEVWIAKSSEIKVGFGVKSNAVYIQ